MTARAGVTAHPPQVGVETTDPMLRHFRYAHLREDLQKYSKPFGELAEFIVANLPRNPERTVALRKLLEAKDCAVRASIPDDA